MENNISNHNDNEIDFGVIFELIFTNKKFIIIATMISVLIALIFAFATPKIYTSKTILSVSNQDDSLSSMIGNYSGLASLAGIALPSESGDKSEEAIERIKSFDFFSKHFLTSISIENLMAVKRWNAKENKLSYKKRQFDESSGKWIRRVSFPRTIVPSAQEAYEEYQDILSIRRDNKTQFVHISISHKSPLVAKKWTDLIIKNINESMREEDQRLAKNFIIFLKKSSEETNLEAMQDAITQLLEIQMQKLMLASSNEDYVFKRIDSPIAPEEESYPNKILILILGLIFGFIIAVLLLFAKNKYLFKPI